MTGTRPAKRPARRRGRWTYNSESTRYGVAGWHLDGTPLVIDFMPGHGWDGKGEYQLYNDPCRINHASLDRYVDGAMREVEEHWDAEHAPAPADVIPDCTCSRTVPGGDHDRDCALNVWTRGGLPSCGLCGAARPCPGACDT